MLSSGFVSLTLFTDRTLLYYKSEAAAASAMLGGTLYWALLCFPMGLLSYVSTFVAQYIGAKEYSRVGVAYQHAMVVAAAFIPFLLIAWICIPYLLQVTQQPEHLMAEETLYLRLLVVGGIGALFYFVQSGLLTGYGRTSTVLLLDGIATLFNIVLDVVLIFGWLGIPALGSSGAAIATAAAFWIKVPLAYFCIRMDGSLRNQFLVQHQHRWEREMFRRLLVYGIPAGLQLLCEAACFSIIMLQVGRLGEMDMAATSLALGINVLAFVPLIGLGLGVGVMVGTQIVGGRVDLARRNVAMGLGLAIAYSLVFAFWVGLFPENASSVYSFGANAERFEAVQQQLIPLLQLVGLYCIFDGIQIVLSGALKGAGDTWFVLGATLVMSTLVVLGGLITQHALGNSLLIWWYAITAWVVLLAAVFVYRYWGSSWEKKRVIESSSTSF